MPGRAAFVIPKEKGAPALTEGALRLLTGDPKAGDQLLHDEITNLASTYKFLHPHLAFPGIFHTPSGAAVPETSETGWVGGFDVVIGNPPWERLNLRDKEFFAVSHPKIAAAPNTATRKRLLTSLASEEPDTYSRYLAAVRQAEAQNHLVRSSGRFPLTARGDINTYAVFAELMMTTISPWGRVGCIVPSGIATDDTTRHFLRRVVDTKTLVSLFEFENAGFFLTIGQGHMNRFCLMTIAGRLSVVATADFLFQGQDVLELRMPGRRFQLAPADFHLLNPNTLTCPIFRTRADAELTMGIYRRVPILLAQNKSDGNPWCLQVLTMLHMGDDSGSFRTHSELIRNGCIPSGNTYCVDLDVYLPLYEARMINLFDHRFGDYALLSPGQTAHVLPTPSDEQHADPAYLPMSRYWVPRCEVLERLRGKWEHDWLIGWRDTTDARASARTVIAAVFPLSGVARNNLPLAAPAVHPSLAVCLVANLSSLVLDFAARQKVGGLHLTFFVLYQLPVLPPAAFEDPAPWDPSSSVRDWLLPRILELTYTAWDLAAFAADLSYEGPPFRWDPTRRTLLRAEMDACFFHLYGIDREDVAYILEAFPIVARYDIAKTGEFRTKRLVLERYDAMAEALASGVPYVTLLNPGPADAACAHLPRSSEL